MKKTREVCRQAERLGEQAIDTLSPLRALGLDLPQASLDLLYDTAVHLESQFRRLADQYRLAGGGRRMSPELLYQLHLDCLGLPKKEAKHRRAAFASLHGVKEDTVYCRLRKLRGDATPKPARVTPRLKRAVEIVWGYKTTPDG